jgi:two-component system, OmpR family, heavy metal sensor histidine kinase CusS
MSGASRGMSIRLRLTCWYASVLLASLALFGAVMWIALENRLIAGVDTRLAQHTEGLRAMLTAEDEPADAAHLPRELAEFASQTPGRTLIQLRDDTGTLYQPSASQLAFPPQTTGVHTLLLNGAAYRIATATVDVEGRRFQALAAAPLDEVDIILRDFRGLLLLLIPAVLALACAGGYWLSGRALRPVDEITAVAKSISVRNLSLRIHVPRTGDELQRMAETWNAVLERLEGSVKRIRQFTADASHELRTPLAVIKATAELSLRREREPDDYRTALRSIESEAERMTALAESLLTLARADSNAMEMPLAPLDLNEAARAAVRQNEALAARKGIRLTAKTNGHAPIVNANALAIERLLLILLDNALKYTPEGGAVIVAAEERPEGGLLSIEDTGAGIAPGDLPHIFERFYRSDPARGAGAGFGLGLSIAQAIAQAHGSQIAVESSPGHGARFWLTLKS